MYKQTMIVFVEGREVELYTIGHAAKILKRSVETLRAWERSKIIPRPMYKHKSVRLYHPIEVEAMKKVLKKLGKRKYKNEELQKEMWAALRVARKEIIHGSSKEESQA